MYSGLNTFMKQLKGPNQNFLIFTQLDARSSISSIRFSSSRGTYCFWCKEQNLVYFCEWKIYINERMEDLHK